MATPAITKHPDAARICDFAVANFKRRDKKRWDKKRWERWAAALIMGAPTRKPPPKIEILQRALQAGLVLLREGKPWELPPVKPTAIPTKDGLRSAYAWVNVEDVAAVFLAKCRDELIRAWHRVRFCNVCDRAFVPPGRADKTVCVEGCWDRRASRQASASRKKKKEATAAKEKRRRADRRKK